MGFLGASVVKNPPASAGAAGSVPGSGRFPGGGNGVPFQYSCLDGQKSLVGYSPWGHKELGMTERLNMHAHYITCTLHYRE